MKYFLERIAGSLYSEYGDRISRHCLVFPGRRAGLFFLKYLAGEISKPLFAPAVMSVNDLFRSLSGLHPAENEILLFELYKAYCMVSGSSESFDNFYFWGDMLLNDFDELDKYMADSLKLFSNVQDLKDIDARFGGFTPEQTEIIKRFWGNFNPGKPTDEKTKFINIWSKLSDLYTAFRKNLEEKHLAYEGMIFRDVAENKRWLADDFRWEMVHFAGFNALNECEKRLMKGLRDAGKARFYWDYDESYMSEGNLNSAGFFLRENIALLGNDMPSGWNYNTFLSDKPASVSRRVINTSSDIAQVKLIPSILEEIPELSAENAHNTAVVLADENLLLPVLTSLPEKITEVNITMGYPLKNTSVYLLLKHLLDMQLNVRESKGTILFAYRDVINILKNDLISRFLSESDREIINEIKDNNLICLPASRFINNNLLSAIFKKPLNTKEVSLYLKDILSLIAAGKNDDREPAVSGILPVNVRNEFIYRVNLAINRLESVSDLPGLSFTVKTWFIMLDRLLRVQSVPFSGEPLTGIQIMGLLETRALDFRNLIILSVNEGILPSVTTTSSFIPFSIREAFRLPSVNHRESVYAYHFYRLLHRAENVTFIFNSNPGELRNGEMSRFLLQMKYEPGQEPEFLNLNFKIGTPVFLKTLIEKTEEHRSRIISRFTGAKSRNVLSPSAINTWLNCRMRFYYRYVNDLREPSKISEEIDPAMLGTLVHETMQSLYADYTGKIVDADKIRSFIKNKPFITGLLNDAISGIFRRENDSSVAVNEQIVRNVLHIYIERILETDSKAAPFKIIAVEKHLSFNPGLHDVPGVSGIFAGGIADRIDIKEGITRILDYKTGTASDSVSSVSSLFKDDRNKDGDAWLQTLLYCEAYLKEFPDARVRPSVYKIKKVPGEKVSDMLLIKEGRNPGSAVDDYSVIRQEFLEGFKGTVLKIADIKEPFIMTSNRSKCRYCPYRLLCQR